jgi:hypothetical protein
MSVNVEPLQFLDVWLKDLRPSLPIVQLNAIDACCLRKVKYFFNQKIPCSLLAVVQHSRVLITYLLPVCTVADFSASFRIKVVKQQVFVLPVVSAGTDSSQTIYDYLDAFRLGFFNQVLERLSASKHLASVHAACDSKRRCIRFLELLLIWIQTKGVQVCASKRNIIPFKYSHQVKCRDSRVLVA